MIKTGLYEQLINQDIEKELAENTDLVEPLKDQLDPAEAPYVLSQYVAEVLEDHLRRQMEAKDSLADVIRQVNRLLEDLEPENKAIRIITAPEEEQMLNAVISRQTFSGFTKKEALDRPVTSIAESSLFTGARQEPSLAEEFKREIISADRIDLLVSFVRWSGIRLIIDELKQFASRGGRLRVITTTYMGATDVKAVEELSRIPNAEIRISYDTTRTRLHAKTYVFYRDTGFTTAYIGSSNLSNAAMRDGLEWNMKITEKDLPATFAKIKASFDGYWNATEFEIYTGGEDRQRLSEALDAERNKSSADLRLTYSFDIHPFAFQQEILDELQAERTLRGNNRNLIVAATGTGKTVISAFDYARFAKAGGTAGRLLFVAHREEILKQSLACYRGVLKDMNFGDLFVGSYQDPQDRDHLFASIQTINARRLMDDLPGDYFDYIVLDESHHDSAPSYQALLDHFKPKVLLGLTATPERMDGQSILPFFGGHITAEIRLPEAIDRRLLCPFQYFAITDVVDLSGLSWQNGGYVRSELEKAYIGDPGTALQRADAIVGAVDRYVTDLRDVKGLCFCATIRHAEYMADYFTRHGIPAIALTGQSSEAERKTAASRLVSGELRFICVVDLYNEGVDIPSVNTILFLRPTESLTIFLQQLGRGLRLAEGKEYLTVLDFIGQANVHYNFEDRFAALLERTHRDVSTEIRQGFSYLPKGCSIKMEKVAQESVLQNIEAAYRGSFAKRMERMLLTFTQEYGEPLTLASFADRTHTDLRDLYRHGTFSQFKAAAHLIPPFQEPLIQNGLFAKAMVKVAWMDSRRWIRYLLELLNDPHPPIPPRGSAEDRMLQMFQQTVWNQSYQACGFATPIEAIHTIREQPVCCAELIELLHYQLDHIRLVDEQANLGLVCPLDLHCTYTRDQLFLALGFDQPQTIREGVKWLEEQKTDVLLITLNKAQKDYSPTTLYEDYSINEHLFHWQSQSTTSADSVTGRRYIEHAGRDTKVLLFVRNDKNRDNQKSKEAEPYVFLGTAVCVRHEGSRPVNIVWQLDHPIPGRYLETTNKMIEN